MNLLIKNCKDCARSFYLCQAEASTIHRCVSCSADKLRELEKALEEVFCNEELDWDDYNWDIDEGWELLGKSIDRAKQEAAKKKCECGALKAKLPGHSKWCPMYSEDEDGIS